MNILSSIANNNPNHFLVCKTPCEDFNTNSVLTVMPGEEAIFIRDGQFVQVFENGRYQLTTENYPFLSRLRNMLSNGVTTYHCSIYFISLTQTTEILWGTSFMLRDPVQQVSTKVFVRGAYRLNVREGAKLLVKLLGLNVNFMMADDIKRYFGNQFQQYIITLISDVVKQENKEMIEQSTNLNNLSASVAPALEPILEEFGLTVSNFAISALEVDANDPNRALLEQAYAKRREMNILGNEYQTIKQTDIYTNLSKNEGVGAFAAITPAVAMGAGMAQSGVGVVSQPANQPVNQPASAPQQPDSQSTPDNMAHLKDKLSMLKQMLDAGLISQDDYDKTKVEILTSLVKG